MARGAPAMTIPLQGGLGNQLFQLAAGLVVEQRLGKAVTYSDHWLRNPAPGETPRALAPCRACCDQANWSRLPPTARARDRPDPEPQGGRAQLRRRRPRTRGPAHPRAGRLPAAARLRRGRLARPAGPARLQQRRRPPPSGAAGRRAVRRAALPARRLPLEPDGERDARGDLSGVLRRGDPQQDRVDWHHRLASGSDDPATALELLRSAELPPGATLRTVESSGEWHDLGLLAAARVCAISNSSFSWWAAFLGRRSRDMQVVAPRPWFLDGTGAEPHLFPVDWERLDRSVLPAHGG